MREDHTSDKAVVDVAVANEHGDLSPETLSKTPAASPIGRPLIGSLIAVLVGTLILRVAAQAMGQMLGNYFNFINDNYYALTYTLTGLITASFFITELFGSLVLGALSDRYGRRLFIILGPVFGAIAVQITSVTVVLWLIAFTRLLEGLSTASSVPSTLGYISEATVGHPNLRARVVGLFELTLVGGIAIGGKAGGELWRYFGAKSTTLAGIHLISPAFAVDGLIYLASLAIFVWGLRSMKRPKTKPADGRSQLEHARLKLKHYAELLQSPAVWMFVPAWLGIFSVIGMWTNHSVRLMTGKHQFTGQLLTGSIAPEKYGNGIAVLAVVFGLGLLGWSFVLGRYRKTNVMLIATVALSALLLTVYGLNHLSSFTSPACRPLLGALLIEVIVLSGFTPAALTYLADVTENYTADRGSIMGLYSVFLGVGQLIGTAIGGKFADWDGIDGLILLSAIFSAITALCLISLRRREIAARPIVV